MTITTEKIVDWHPEFNNLKVGLIDSSNISSSGLPSISDATLTAEPAREVCMHCLTCDVIRLCI